MSQTGLLTFTTVFYESFYIHKVYWYLSKLSNCERARFNRRNQRQGETEEGYIMALYDLAETSEYSTMKEDSWPPSGQHPRRRTLSKTAATRNPKAKKEVRQREAVHEQQLTPTGASTNDTLETVRSAPKRPGRQPPQASRQKSSPTATASRQCTRWGKGQHPKEKCPAREAECHRCHCIGHYSTQSQSQQLQPAPPPS